MWFPNFIHSCCEMRWMKIFFVSLARFWLSAVRRWNVQRTTKIEYSYTHTKLLEQKSVVKLKSNLYANGTIDSRKKLTGSLFKANTYASQCITRLYRSLTIAGTQKNSCIPFHTLIYPIWYSDFARPSMKKKLLNKYAYLEVIENFARSTRHIVI